LRVRVHLADFGHVHRRVRALRNLDESHRRAEIDHAGIDGQAPRVDLLRARRHCDVRADGGDLAVADHDRAALDVRAGDGDDARVANRVSARRAGHELRSHRARRLLRPCREGQEQQRGERDAKDTLRDGDDA
jgi:hypothetical protein